MGDDNGIPTTTNINVPLKEIPRKLKESVTPCPNFISEFADAEPKVGRPNIYGVIISRDLADYDNEQFTISLYGHIRKINLYLNDELTYLSMVIGFKDIVERMLLQKLQANV